MCGADSTLEWARGGGASAWGFEHTCRDYEALSRWAEDNRYDNSTGIMFKGKEVTIEI